MSDAPAAHGLTAELARRSSSLRYDELPEDVVELARQCLLDWFAVTLAGSREDGPLMLLEVLPGASEADRASASIVGHRRRMSPLHAALLNGTSSHRLDFDDVNMSFIGHASVAVIAAALALAEQIDADGAQLLCAFLAGYETACRVALAIGPEPYLRGFHYTGTVGTFGAAAACARLLELDPAQTAVAFGLAASEAAGSKANFGTMTKSLHAGRACEAGLLAAQLAARGFSASATAIEHEQGFAALAGGSCDAPAALAAPSGSWHLRENLFKYHAACYFTHSAIDGVEELRDGGLTPESLQQLTLHIGELELGACAIPAPATGLEVKFSIAHLAAMALLGRDTSLIEDSDAADQDVLALRSRVLLADDGTAGAPTRVEALLHDGSRLAAARDLSSPERDLPAQWARLERKYAALARPVLGSAGAERLAAAISGLGERSNVRTLMALARA